MDTIRQEQIIEAIKNDDLEILLQLAATSDDHEEKADLLDYAHNIEDSDWAHDRMKDEKLSSEVTY